MSEEFEEEPQDPGDDGDRAYDAMKDEEAGRYFEQMDAMFATQDMKFLKHLYCQEADYLIRQDKPIPQFVRSLRYFINKKEGKPLETKIEEEE